MKITSAQSQILDEILLTQTNTQTGTEILTFRVKFEDHRAEIQTLVHNHLLRNDEKNYYITLQGILHLNTEASTTIINELNKILDALKQIYREAPGKPSNSEVLTQKTNCSYESIANAVLLLSDLGIFSSRDVEPHGYKTIQFTLAERVLDLKALEPITTRETITSVANDTLVQKLEKPKEKWSLIRPIGGGGQGQVLLAKESKKSSGPKYAYKKITNENRVHRFKNEVQAIRTLSHENIVKIIDHEIEGKNSFIVYEFCEGLSLDKKGPFTLEESWRIFFDVCSGLAHAHDNGIYHRDIKPANILLRKERSEAVVADFGLCLIEEGERHTEHDEAVGPRLFMAPELEDGKLDDVTGACDVYSLGKLLYWLLSNGKIFSREKHRELKYDLSRMHGDGRFEYVNLLLDHMLRHDSKDRLSHAGLVLTPAREALRLFEGRFKSSNPINTPRCMYCGIGNYELIADGEQSISAVRNFGISPTGADVLKVFGCHYCGHIQLFRPDLAKNSSMWPKITTT